jgi:hypothetical protein
VNRIPLLAAAASAAVYLTAQPAPTLAATSVDQGSSPVAVNACQAYTMSAGKAASRTSTIEIRFRDLGQTPVDAVGFDVNWGAGDVQAIHDVGTFSPGVSVEHKFVHADPNASSPLFPHPPVTCHVESVRFADGSTWNRAAGAQS